jgi:WD40 repeat protein
MTSRIKVVSLKDKSMKYNIITTTFLFILSSCAGLMNDSKFKDCVIVCGDSKVLLAKYPEHNDSVPEIIWSWDAHTANDLPIEYRTRKFNSIDDCKTVPDRKQIMISSSSGAIAVVNVKDKKVTFFADVPNAHSIEFLPDNKIIAAASTAADGNRLMLFDITQPAQLSDSDSLYSAHGVVWDKKRDLLFALGYDILREYKIQDKYKLVRNREWKIPGVGGHDLQMAPDGNNLFVTEQTGSWIFDLRTSGFSKIEQFPDAENIKSINQNKEGQYLYTVPEESWWTYHVRFFNPYGVLSFPVIRVYKSRYFKY